MYKGPSRSIVRIPQNFFIYYTSDWNFLVTWTKLLKHQCQVSISEQTCMCFLTYICNYLFFYFMLCFIIKTAIESFHFMEVLLYQANTWSSFACMLFCCTKLSVKHLLELRYQDMISVQCNVNNLLPNVDFSKVILSHENCMSHSMSILSGKYTYPFFSTHLSKTNFVIASSIPWTSFILH